MPTNVNVFRCHVLSKSCILSAEKRPLEKSNFHSLLLTGLPCNFNLRAFFHMQPYP